MDGLRDEDLVDDGPEFADLNLRVERVFDGVWMIARTDSVAFDEFNDLRRRFLDP
jgi:hypothetical protein